jgi:WD40 repeat protein
MSAATDSRQGNPFPGLRPFGEGEEHLFFGRENQIDAMVDKLADTRFLAVVGTSGSGKSSLVNCGLRPALHQGLMARAGGAWRMAQFRPGNDPIGAMARELAPKLFSEHAAAGMTLAEIVETTLRMSKLGLIDICEQAALDEGVNLLVVVDQFEELFRYRQLEVARRGGDHRVREEAAAFVNLLLEVKERPTCPIFIVLTMRSDFLGDCTQFPGLAEAINAGQYLVPRLTRDERRAAIECPVRVGGAEITPVLLTRLVNDVGDDPDQLSILQHALNRTWASWQNEGGGKGPLDLAHYEAIGTMDHALDHHAERAYAELGRGRQQQICERLFKALTDKANDARGVRRPTTLGTLCTLVDATPAEITDVIDVFRKPSRSFLMPPAGDAIKAETVIDISHESLMRVWQRLKKWSDEEDRSARTYRRLAETAVLHAAGNASLWRDPELQLALDWRERCQPNETWASLYHPGFAAAMGFLTESSAAREAERAEREQRRQRELEAEQEKADAQARYARRMRLAAVFSFAFAVVAVIFGVMARDASKTAQLKTVEATAQKTEAEKQKAEAQNALNQVQFTKSRLLVKEAEQHPHDASTRILLALEVLPDAAATTRPEFFIAQTLLTRAINDLRELHLLVGHTGPVRSVALTPDGTRIVTGSSDKTARVWNAGTGEELFQLRGHTGAIWSVALTPDGTRIVTGSDDNTARVWNAGTGAELLQLKGHTGTIRSVALTPDGTRIVTGSDDNTARVWNAGTGKEMLQLKGHARPVLGVAITPDGTRIVTGSADNLARVWDASTGKGLFQLRGHTGAVSSVALTPDGIRIVTGSDDKTARVWDVGTDAALFTLEGHTGPVGSVAITPGGNRIVTGSTDNTARVWNASTGKELLQVKGHTRAVLGVAVTPDGARIVTGSTDNTARVWDARTDAELLQLKGHPRAVLSVALTPDGARIVTGSDNTARVWDASTGRKLLQLEGHTGFVGSVALTPDGTRIVTGSADKTARVWDASTGTERFKLEGHTGPVRSVALTPDGTRIVTGSYDRTARVWNAGTGEELFQLRGHTDAVWGVAVDGVRIVTGSTDKTARVWDAGTGAELFKLEGHTGAVSSVALTPDGTRIVTGSYDKTARVWDASTGTELLALKGHTRAVLSVVVDGARIVTGSDDNTARVWDASTGAELFQLKGHTGAVWGVAVTPDGDGARIVTGSTDNTARVWSLAQLRPLSPQHQVGTLQALQALHAFVDYGKAVVPRCLTIEQRQTFRLRPEPPEWCIVMGKYPYDTQHWRAWKAGNMPDAVDLSTAYAYGNFAHWAIEAGDYNLALDAAELSIKFGPKLLWMTMNRTHAFMFLGRTEQARKEYLEHRGKILENSGKPWEVGVVDDFKIYRELGHEHPLMIEIEQAFNPPPSFE